MTRALRTPSEVRWWLAVGALGVVAVALSAVVQLWLLPLHSDNLDEGVYLFQARMLADGRLTLPADTHGEFFRPWLSGERDGRIFTQYQVGLPAFLAASDAVLGSWRAGLALVAGLNVVVVAGLGRRLFDDRTVGLGAAALAGLSPMLILHSGLVLTYSLTVLALVGAAWATVAAADRCSWRLSALAGAAWGAGVLVRPLDALLVLVPVVALAAARLARVEGLRRGPVLLAVAGVAGLPALLVTLWYNVRTTGAPLEFPNMAADPLNGFGFGTRRLTRGEPTIDYRSADALDALIANLAAVPGWLLGGVVTVALAGVGAVAAGRRAERLALGALVLAFPAVYATWWATRLSAEFATHGLGPHYYVPSFVALALLAARGAAVAWGAASRAPFPVPRTVIVLLVVAVAAALTAWSLPPKVEEKRAITERNRRVLDQVPGDLDDAVVVVDYRGRPTILSRYPFLVTDPALEGDVLYAADRGPDTVALADRFPDRDLYRLRNELRPGEREDWASATFRALDLVEGESLELVVRPGELPSGRTVRAFVDAAGTREEVDLGTTGSGPLASTTFRLGDGGLALDEPATVVAGVEMVDEGGDLSAVEVTLDVAVGAGRLRTLAPGQGWTRGPHGGTRARLAEDVDDRLQVEVTPG